MNYISEGGCGGGVLLEAVLEVYCRHEGFRISFSSSLHKVDNSDIGLYEAGFFGSFPDLSLGMILALFHD